MNKKSPSLQVQTFINNKCGQSFTTQQLKSLTGKKKASTVATYLYNIKKHGGYIQEIERGKYLILKQIKDIRHICYSPSKIKSKKLPTNKSQKPSMISCQKHKKMIKKISYTEHYDNGKMLIECSFSGVFSCFAKRGVDAVCIPGPNVERHIQFMAANVIKDKGTLILVDRDHEVMKRYYDIMNNPVDYKISEELKERIAFSQENIASIGHYNAPYQDIDLMSSWGTFLPIIKKRLSLQITHSTSPYSCIIGTIQEITKEGKTNIEWLNELLCIFQSPIDDWNVIRKIPVAGPYLKSYEVPCINENSKADVTFYRLQAFKYKDGVKPMFTFQLVYKTDEARKYLVS